MCLAAGLKESDWEHRRLCKEGGEEEGIGLLVIGT